MLVSTFLTLKECEVRFVLPSNAGYTPQDNRADFVPISPLLTILGNATPESLAKTATTPEYPSQDGRHAWVPIARRPPGLSPHRKMAAMPEPHRKMATTPEPHRKMATTAEPCQITAVAKISPRDFFGGGGIRSLDQDGENS